MKRKCTEWEKIFINQIKVNIKIYKEFIEFNSRKKDNPI